LYDSGSLIKSCSLDTKTDNNTEFAQPLSFRGLKTAGQILLLATPRQFQLISVAGRTKICICRAHSNIIAICVCMYVEGMGVAHCSHFLTAILPTQWGAGEREMKHNFPSGNYRENFKQAECNYLKWNRTLYPTHHST